jgi:hypothetical protein
MEKEEFMQIFIRIAFTNAINDQLYMFLSKYLMCFIKPNGNNIFTIPAQCRFQKEAVCSELPTLECMKMCNDHLLFQV